MARTPRGFAILPAEQRQAIASQGGRAAHLAGTGRQWTAEEAREVGRKGGLKRAANDKARREAAKASEP